ncbi:hypothetical protein BDV59DRAFT_207291 [Aspergillus ambiguus]|uniref:uncharacterized protein n=1 Tax=Aspergillus ambiguus TaxID=176160 RepID=UPI003CCE3BEB
MTSTSEFRCDIPGCNASYRRKEHLNRHKVRHIPHQPLQCPVCDRVFTRKDILRRHVRQKHPGERAVPIRQACISCRALKARCEGGPPCTGCVRRKVQCSFHDNRSSLGEGQSPQQLNKRSPDKTDHFLELYFQLFHQHWPFVHRGSFNQKNETPLLVQSMVVIGMWVSDVPSAKSAAIDLHKTLEAAIYQQREKWDGSLAENVSSICTWPIPMYQAILLHIIFSLICNVPTSLTLALKPCLTPTNCGLLASLVQSCRRLGMFQYANMLARYTPDDPAEYVWVGVQEVTRFDLALYRLCKYHGFEKHTMVPGWQLTADELHFPMPKNEALWNAKGKNEWTDASRNMDWIDLGDIMRTEWIAKSAELLQLI